MKKVSTLNEAIKNAIEESKTKILAGQIFHSEDVIENHVRDYLARKFAPAISLSGGLEALRIESLWYEITGNRIVKQKETVNG